VAWYERVTVWIEHKRWGRQQPLAAAYNTRCGPLTLTRSVIHDRSGVDRG